METAFFNLPPRLLSFLQYGNKYNGGIIAPWDFKVVPAPPIKEWTSPILKKWNSEGLEMTICCFQLLLEAPAESFAHFLSTVYPRCMQIRAATEKKRHAAASKCKTINSLVHRKKKRQGRGWGFQIKGENIFGPVLWDPSHVSGSVRPT